MKRLYLIFFFIIIANLPVTLYAQENINHNIKVTIEPETHLIDIEDTITLPESFLKVGGGEVHFILHKGLQPVSKTDGVTVTLVNEKTQPEPDTDSIFQSDNEMLEHYILNLPATERSFTLKYKGVIYHPLQKQEEESDRSFTETPGIISAEGVYLAASSYWYPQFSDDLVTFSMEVQLPQGWKAISQGGGKATIGWATARMPNKSFIKKTKFRKFLIQDPQDEIYLIAGKFTKYTTKRQVAATERSYRSGGVTEKTRTRNKSLRSNSIKPDTETLVFLRNPDQKLADKYLDTGSQYLKMYSKLLGPYPYKKFALIENFWQTGYGMPSFTLLGSKIIRFPFILHSSYPHEILHNWWGNGVFVDFSSGNWSEGLTAYLSDHLIKEQRGQGKEYRRATLQKYTNYVAESKDFPLTEFRSRHSSATEAVGYGKTLMFFHMLRLQLGNDVFVKGLQKFYREYKFKRATFENLKEVFGEISGKDLQIEFDQWTKQTGAPEIRVSNATAWRGKRGYRPDAQQKLSQKNKGSQVTNTAAADEKGYKLTALLEQVQEGPAYTLQIPVTVILEDSQGGKGRNQMGCRPLHNKNCAKKTQFYRFAVQEAYQTTLLMDSKRSEISLHVPSKPLRLDVDPEFDIFRRLHRNETPPTLSRAFGSDKALIILPSTASQDFLNEYRKVAESWQKSPSRQIEIKLDNEIEKIPGDHTVWLFGKENRFKSKILDAMTGYNVSINDTNVNILENEVKRKNHSVILTTEHPDEPDSALAWVSTDNVAAISGLGRKLPHYGKYSYLAFEGDEPSIVLKGQWPTLNSPMSVVIPQTGILHVPKPEPKFPLNKGGFKGVVTKLTPRKALAYLPAVFSEDRMMNVIRFLADNKMKGRGFGTAELDRAAEFIASKFREAGLKPAGDDIASYFQEWSAESGEFNQNTTLKNVIGVIPGNNSDFNGQSVVISAHYDHLGLGWPDVRKGNKGKVHPGADDNASGVAILLELAQTLGKTWKPDRTVVFAAFTGEEAGRIGSKFYVKNEKQFPVDKSIGVLNLDTVGRLGKNKLMIFGTGSAREWIHIFMGAGYVTGVAIEPVAKDFGSSDQKSFLDAGVPSVQFFSGPHTDYHSPTDTVDKIDTAGLIKVASVLKEAVEYLANRKEPLTRPGPQPNGLPPVTQNKFSNGLPPVALNKQRRVSLGTIPDFTYEGKGVRLAGTLPSSPAEQVGLQKSDLITFVNEKPVYDLLSFSNLLKSMKPGDTAVITFLRDGKEKTVKVEVEGR